jgi:hypothetical protein
MASILKRLFRFLARAPEQTPAEQEEFVEEAQVDSAALEAFSRLVTAHLGEAESKRLTRQVVAHDEGFLYAVQDDDGQQANHWLMLSVDWKAYDEVQWQIDLMLATRGIESGWTWQLPDQASQRTVMSALKSLAHWLPSRDLALLHIDSGGDDYQALIVGQGQAAEILSLGAAAGITIMSHRDFLSTQHDQDADLST